MNSCWRGKANELRKHPQIKIWRLGISACDTELLSFAQTERYWPIPIFFSVTVVKACGFGCHQVY